MSRELGPIHTYMQRRYYEPILGRFLSVDPLATDANLGAGFNRYAYANTNPYRFIDPDGRAAAGTPSPESQTTSGYSVKKWWEDVKCSFSGRCGGWPGNGPMDSLAAFPLVRVEAAVARSGAAAARLGQAVEETVQAARGATATRSTLQIGQQMHKAYKADLVDDVSRFKEFRFNTGRRADFIDLEKGIIYELKPNNARSIREGTQQLQQYLRDAQAQFPGINWRTVLDTY